MTQLSARYTCELWLSRFNFNLYNGNHITEILNGWFGFQHYNWQKIRTFSAPMSNFRTFQGLKTKNLNSKTFQDPWEPWCCVIVTTGQDRSPKRISAAMLLQQDNVVRFLTDWKAFQGASLNANYSSWTANTQLQCVQKQPISWQKNMWF